MAQIGSLSVKLGLVTAQWTQDTAKARQDAKALQNALDDLGGGLKTLQGYWKTLGGGIGVASIGFAGLLQQTLAFSNEIKDLSDGFGISISKTLQFRDALQHSGVSAEKATKMMSTLFSKIQEAKEGNEVTITQFERMGLSFKELTNLAPEKAINRVFESLSKIPDVYQRIKYIKDMLGKAGIGIDPAEVAERLNMSLEQYKKHEEELKTLAKVSENLKTSMNNLTLAFANLISPFARDGLVSIEKFKVALLTIGSVAVVNGIKKVVDTFVLLRGAILSLNTAISASTAIGLMFAAIGYVYSMGAEQEEKNRQKAADTPVKRRWVYGTKQKDGTWGEGHWEEVKSETQKTEDEAVKIKRAELTAAQEKVAFQQKSLELQRQENEYGLEAYKYSEYQNKQVQLMFDYQKQLIGFKEKEAQIRNQYKDKDAIRGEALKELSIQKQAAKEAYEYKAKLLSQEEQQRQSFSAGWNDSFKKYAEDAQNYSKVGAEAFKVVTQSMEDAIVKFVTTGKLSFKSFAQTIITELIRIQAQAMARNILGGMSGMFGSIGGVLSSWMSGGSSTDFLGASAGQGGGGFGLKFADGGNPPVGVASLVGERGPELFIPKTAGTIVPNNQLSGALGSTTVNNYNISAIDTQSFEQRLYGSSNAIWAANQYAQKNINTNRART